MSKKKLTIDDLAIIMKKGFEKQDKRFEKQDKRFEKQDKRFEKQDEKIDNLARMVKQGFDAVDKRFEKQDKKIESIDNKVEGLKTTMVTKDYLDEKMTDLRGDLVILTRKEDTKLKALINILSKRKIISQADQEKIFSMEPFPELKLNV